MVGPGGVGKSRLALQWLRDLQAKGWHVGFLQTPCDWLGSAENHRKWKPPAPTAIVIDYSSQHGEKAGQMLVHLHSATTGWPEGCKVRVLLLDRASGGMESAGVSWARLTDSFRPLAKAQESCHRVAAPEPGSTTDTRPEPLHLAPIEDAGKHGEILNAVAEKLGKAPPPYDEAIQAYFNRVSGKGLPLYLVAAAMRLVEFGEQAAANRSDAFALLNDIVRDEIEHWRTTWKRPENEYFWSALLGSVGFVTLCNGLTLGDAESILPQAVKNAGNVSWSTLSKALAGILPGRAGDGFDPLSPVLLAEHYLLIQGAPPEDDSPPFPEFNPADWVLDACRVNPEGLSRTLLLMCIDYPDAQNPRDWVSSAVEGRTDDPDFPAEAVGRIWVMVNALHTPENDGALREAVSQTIKIAGHSNAAAQAVASELVFAIGSLGDQKAWSELEAFGGVYESLPNLREAHLSEAEAAVNAIGSYGEARIFSGLERWAKRLDLLLEDWGCERDFRIEECKATFNAISRFCEANQFNRLGCWAERLDALLEHWGDHREFRYLEAQIAFNVIYSLGNAHEFATQECWAKRFDALLNHWRDDREICLLVAKAALNAISDYGRARDFASLERWARRLDAALEGRKEDREFRLEEAKVAVCATVDYGEVKDFGGLERWANQLNVIFEDIGRNDSEIITILNYGAAMAFGLASEFRNAERLMSFAEHAPWCQPLEGQPPIAMLTPPLIAKHGGGTAKWKALKKRAKRLMEEAAETQLVLNGLQGKELDASGLARRWSIRRFLPNWGKDLWSRMAQLPDTEWIGEALADPWISPEERRALEELRRQKEG